MFKADLHIHSQFSDGHWPAKKIIEKAHELNLQGLSITDHDSTSAYPQILQSPFAQKIKIIPGIEVSSHYKETTVHVLGYGYNLESSALQEVIQALSTAREQRIHLILERLKKRNIQICYEELTQTFHEGQLGRPHIASLMVQKGYASTIAKAFDHYLSDTHVGSLKLKALETEEAIDIIHQAKGYAVLAHPHLVKHKNKLRAILSLPFDGIEAYYAKFIDKADYFVRIAQEKDWLVTGGSDFHYPKPYQPLGCSYTPEEPFKVLYQRTVENNLKYYQEPLRQKVAC